MAFINNPGAGPSVGFPGIWTMPTSLALPVDAVPSVWTIACGTQALTSAWLSGNLFDVQSAGTHTIAAINGYPDIVTLAGLMGIDPHTGIGGLACSKWYDQSGGGNNLTQATATNQPWIVLINGQVYVATDGMLLDFVNGVFNLDKYFSWPSISTNNQAQSVYALLQSSSGGAPIFGGSYISLLFTNTTTISSGYMYGGGSASSTAEPLLNAFDWVGFTSHVSTIIPECQTVVLGTVSGTGATNFTMTQNEETSTVTSIPVGTSTGGQFGAAFYLSGSSSGTATGLYAKTKAFMVATSALTSGQQTTMRESLYQMGEISSAPIYNVLVDGASIDVGEGAFVGGVSAGVMAYGWADQVLNLVPTPFRLGNTSVPGATIAQLTATWATAQANYFSVSYKKNIVIGPAGAAGNTILGGKTGTQAFTDLQSYITAVKAAGAWDAIVVTTLGTGQGPQYIIYNNLVIANAATLGITVARADLLPPPIGNWDTTNATYFNQVSPYTTHPTVVGYAVLAQMYATILDNILGV